jgi:predicted acyl esterase
MRVVLRRTAWPLLVIPLVNLNPQTFMDIPRATEADFRKATERVHRGGRSGSRIDLSVVPTGEPSK